MTASRSRRVAGVVLAGLLAGLASMAVAQQDRQRLGAPVQLRPPGEATRPAPARTDPLPPTNDASRDNASGGDIEGRRLPGRKARRGGGASATGVQVQRLRAVDPAAIGLLSEADGGLGADMWAGSRLDTIVALLARLPVEGTSPVMHDLARRLLLTGARVPEGETASGSDLLLARLDRLAAAGRNREVKALLDRAPPGLETPALLAARIDGLWLADDREGACAMAFNMIERSNETRWLKPAAFCHALDGDVDRVALFEELLLEALPETEDPAFYALLGAASGRGGEPLVSLPSPTPLHLAMLRTVDWPLPADAVADAGVPLARHLVESRTAPEAVRLEAAERAAATRRLAISRLRELYALARFEPGEREDGVAWAQANPGARANALLYQLARARKRPLERAGVIADALRPLRGSDRFTVVARANKTALMTLRPVSGLIPFAPELARALLVSGEPELALGWYRLVEAGGDVARELAWRSLWPVMLVAGDGLSLPFDPARFAVWLTPDGAAPTPERLERAALLLTVLEAMGHTVPEATWTPLYGHAGAASQQVASAALLRGLARASAAGRRGEAVLLALIALGPSGPAGAGAATLAAVIDAFRRLGFEAEARAVALEAIVAQAY